MSKQRLDPQVLAELPESEFCDRIRNAFARIESRGLRAEYDQRSLTMREKQLNDDDKEELEALKAADEIRQRADKSRQEQEYSQRSAEIGAAIDARARGRQLSPLAVSGEHIDMLEEARRRGQTITVVEERAALLTTDFGSRREYLASGLLAPRTLWRASGIPTTTPATGYTAVTPSFTLPDGAALKTENVAGAEFDAVNPSEVTLGRAHAWSDISSEGLLSTSIAEITAAHSRIVSRHVDYATVAAIEAAADAGNTIDEALLQVADEAAADVTSLWIVGTAAALSTLVGNATFTPTSGPDTESFAAAYGGAKVYVSGAATADVLTVFHPQSFRAYATSLSSATVIDASTAGQRLGSWMFFGLGCSLVGSAISIGGTAG
ncbi:hypothetical protein U8D42_04005 [Mycobacterium europaeum]|uniref:hypothetical protein n=1 Tax=Mycobacterium europaeum TaxID=761804 RepID=UPI002ADF9568|nr:hypothetical protein [Mycobacterium europaeum]MEA1159276.1 hypothetical protein [Mycobacterium europaeum]